MKYTEILKENRQLGESLESSKYKISILSNIVAPQLNEILEYYLRKEKINACAKSGNYDNIVQDSSNCKEHNLVIIFWEAANLIEGLQYKANVMAQPEYDALMSKTKSEIDFVISNLKDNALVLFNKFSSMIFNSQTIKPNKFDDLCYTLNEHLKQKAQSNIKIVDIDKIIADVSVPKSIDTRYFYSSKALYTVDFYKRYVQYAKPIILSATGKTKKALIFDCDNALWKGIIGEDGFDKIEMSSKTGTGAIFEEVQNLALELNKKGILIGLCSKNNPGDVEEVLQNHPDMLIRNEHLTIKKVNWQDKVTNLREIANELNIGLDSLVFIDDSSFEVNYIKEQLPQVAVFQVPNQLHKYPSILRENMELFYTLSESQEDIKRSQMYKQREKREQEKGKFSNLDDYLKSLDLKLTIYVDNKKLIPRMSQMTQKTNQFNLTTRRYTEADIDKFVGADSYRVFAFDASDKFGSSGVTGLCIVRLSENKKCLIDTFLMSCRVIGRNLEFSFFDCVVETIKNMGIEQIEAGYYKTIKNNQVEDFYDRLGFQITKKTDNEKLYKLQCSQYKLKNISYIGVEHG